MTKNSDVWNVTYTNDPFMEAVKQAQDLEQEFIPDSIVQNVLKEHTERAKKGKEKYNATLDRTDLSVIDYLQHAKEEAMDLALYLEKTIQMLKGNK